MKICVISKIERKHNEDPGKRLAQNVLAEHIIGMLSGGDSNKSDSSV